MKTSNTAYSVLLKPRKAPTMAISLTSPAPIPVGAASVLTTWSIFRKRESVTRKLPIDSVGLALLVLGAGFFVIFFAGLSWKVMGGLVAAFLAALPLFWSLMHDYQQQRVLTLLDPTKDPKTIDLNVQEGEGKGKVAPGIFNQSRLGPLARVMPPILIRHSFRQFFVRTDLSIMKSS